MRTKYGGTHTAAKPYSFASAQSFFISFSETSAFKSGWSIREARFVLVVLDRPGYYLLPRPCDKNRKIELIAHLFFSLFNLLHVSSIVKKLPSSPIQAAESARSAITLRISSPGSSTGVSAMKAAWAKRSSQSNRRNAAEPIVPSPMCSWRSSLEPARHRREPWNSSGQGGQPLEPIPRTRRPPSEPAPISSFSVPQ